MTTIDFVVPAALAGERLDRAVSRQVRERGLEVSNRQAKTLVEDGAVRVGGKAIRHASHRLSTGDAVEVRVDVEAVTRVSEVVDLTSQVIYRDDVLLAINKPSGLPTHATHDPERDHAQAGVQRLLGPDAYVAIHHRLDVETSGVLVFAIDRAANKGLADAFAGRTAHKSYVALVTRTDLPASFDVQNHLSRDRHDSKRMCAVTSGGDFASTTFEVRRRSPRGALVVAHPQTGRTHQIRVHLQGFAAPIVGDVLYGGVAAARMMLHAERLVLPHPVTGDPLELSAPAPPDFVTVAAEYEMEAD